MDGAALWLFVVRPPRGAGDRLYFSWLLIRTGSVWVTIFCHAVYNTNVGLILYSVTLPPVPSLRHRAWGIAAPGIALY
ncbi:MAG: CPBP family glutamic-type intramembrane protease [Hyphomicrobium sp.]